MSRRGDHAILYDADCGFCTRMLDAILRRDRGERLRAVAIQSEEGEALLEAGGVPASRRLDSWHLAAPDGTVTSGGIAGAPLLRLLPAGAPIAALLAAFPAATEAGYRWIAAHRGLLSRFFVLALALSVAGLAAGCGSTVQEGSKLTVYMSVPQHGPQAAIGRATFEGANRALMDAGGEAGGAQVELVELDDTSGKGPGATWSQAQVAANARRATEDSTSIAYIGELESDATRVSAPITNSAGLLQLTAGPVDRDLLAEPGGNDVPKHVQTTGERTLGTLWDPKQLAKLRVGSDVFGYATMAGILDAIGRASDPLSRGDVVDAFMSTEDLPSRLGTYTIGPDGAAAYSGPPDLGQG